MAEINIAQPMRFTVDVRNGLIERPQRESLMRGDKSANRIIVELMYGSEPFDITGVEVRGKFCRPPNGDEVGLTGTAEGNVATVQLTDQCYTSGGHYEASVSLVLGGVERTVLFISGDVLKSGSGSAAGDEEGDEEGGGSGSGLPSGGTAGQVLVKVSSAEGAAIWKTLTAADVGARPDNWMPSAQDVGALPENGTAADSEKLGGKAPEYYIQPRNLLDNSDFRNPVNQRGIAYGATRLNGWTIDRWYYDQSAGAGNGYFGLTEYYVSLFAPTDGYSQMHQNLELYDKMKGGDYTFAALIQYGDNVKAVVAVSFKMGEVPSGLNLIEDGNLKLYSVDGLNILIRATGTPEYKFIWAALYEGEYTADNLPPYVPEKLVTELITCQQYVLVIGGVVRYRATQITSSVIDFTIPIPVKMRTTPSFDASALTVYGTSGDMTSVNAQTGFTFSILQVDDNAICIRATKSAHGLVDAFLNVAERTVFSADL